jgi:site-specific DNA recombinase
MKTSFQSKPSYFMYARKSSESEDRQVQSIDDQIARLKELAHSLGIEIKEIFTEAKSAKKPYIRPLFDEMVKRIEKGEANGILTWHLNRLSRNPVDSGTLGWMLQQSVLQSIQTMERQYLPDDNVLLFSVETGMANQYIIELRKSCMRGMDRKAELGWKPGMAPLGYVNDKEHKIIKPDTDRFVQVRKMWDLMLTGNYTPQAIRKIANEQWGFTTIRHKRRGGTQIPLWGIYTLFNNIFYAGMFRWKGNLFRGNHTPMITVAEYEKVQAMLGKKGNRRSQHHSFAYTGLIRCESCPMMFSATEKYKLVKSTGMWRPYVYYHCSRKSKNIKCANPPISLSALESQFEKELEHFTIVPELLDWALKYIDSENEKVASDFETITLKQKQSLNTAQKELENLTRMRYQELIEDSEYIKERTALKDRIMKLQVQLNEKTDHTKKWNELTRKAFIFAAYARQTFAKGSVEVKRSIVSSFGSNYRIKDNKLIFDSAFWIIPIKNACSDLLSEYNRLELRKHFDTEAWNAYLKPYILVVCTRVEEVRTAIKTNNDTNLYIPLLREDIDQIKINSILS